MYSIKVRFRKSNPSTATWSVTRLPGRHPREGTQWLHPKGRQNIPSAIVASLLSLVPPPRYLPPVFACVWPWATKLPWTVAAPKEFSPNEISETMNESSTTVPQFRHATWPEESSKSLGLELEHPGQTFADIAADSGGCGSIPLDYWCVMA